MNTTTHDLNQHILDADMLAHRAGLLITLAVCLVAAWGSFFSPPAQAGTLYGIGNGIAIHLDPPPASAPPGYTFNERNWGTGFEYEFSPWKKNWIPFITASYFKDSNRNPSYYAGGGISRRYVLSEKFDRLHFDLGIVAFLMTRKWYQHNRPFPGALPVFSFGTEHVAVNMTYIPKMDPKMAALTFFQLKIKLMDF